MKAILYHRVSTFDQDPDLAMAELRAAAAARGWTVAKEIRETGSGARNDRPGLQAVMKGARSLGAGAVMVWKLDRFGRSALDLLTNAKALQELGCRFVATSQGIDIHPMGDAISTLLLQMLAAIAEFERTLIMERTRLGMAKARAAGVRFGRPRLVPFEVVAAGRRLRRQGHSWAAVSRMLVDVGHLRGKTRRPWSPSTLRDACR